MKKTIIQFSVLLASSMLLCNPCLPNGMPAKTLPPPAKTQNLPAFVINLLGLQKANPQPTFGKQYINGYESWKDFAAFYVVPADDQNSATHLLTNKRYYSGKYSHSANIFAENPVIINQNTNHRAYPTYQFNKTSLGVITHAVFIEYEVWADFTLSAQPNANWFSLGTFTSYSDQYWARGFLINVDNTNKINLMHVPQNGESIRDIHENTTIKFPYKQWVRISVYIDYTANNKFNSPFVAVWQNGTLVSAARFDNRIDPATLFQDPQQPACLNGLPSTSSIEEIENACGLVFTNGLAQAHFGLYAPPLLGAGNIYNDALKVSEVLFP